MSVWQDLKVKLLDERDKPPRKWDKDDATALQRMAKTKAWALYLTMIDAEVKLLSERLLNEDPAKMPLTVAEIKGLRKMPEKLNLIFREMESHDQIPRDLSPPQHPLLELRRRRIHLSTASLPTTRPTNGQLARPCKRLCR
jgi:hypothetical protein